MNIDQDAPLRAQKEIVIAAPVDKVWTILTDIQNWPRWQPDVSSAELEGDLSIGTIFRWKAKGLNITSTIQEVALHSRIGWTGESIGMKAAHIWTLEPLDNATRVKTEESLAGWFPRILKIFDPTFLEKSLTGSLHDLKVRAEQ